MLLSIKYYTCFNLVYSLFWILLFLLVEGNENLKKIVITHSGILLNCYCLLMHFIYHPRCIFRKFVSSPIFNFITFYNLVDLSIYYDSLLLLLPLMIQLLMPRSIKSRWCKIVTKLLSIHICINISTLYIFLELTCFNKNGTCCVPFYFYLRLLQIFF